VPDQPATYPAEPWRLCGELHAAALLAPLDEVPLDPPPGWTPVRLAGRAVLGLAWVDYRPDGVLTYRELLVVTLVRRGVRVLPHIVAIWVDSPASRDGGRELWGIPKQLADFLFAPSATGPVDVAARDGAGPIAAGKVHVRRRLPWRVPVRFSIVQSLQDGPKVSPVRARGRLAATAVTVRAAPQGPLGFLTGRRPLFGVSLLDFDMRFGTAGR
jgi:hypothetical protein